ncbi:unnamed protein product, partial [Mesorhabditis belari]|uniref:peptidylprolyl isomerase n=1 Tax=Mesorhabditis belari TaxID=2138241 RepID=A0AAF3FDN5_9BILA
MATIDITPNQDGGIQKKVLREGTGTTSPVPGSTVFVHYVGTLADGGEKFDSSRDRGDEFKFALGREQVIKGWDLGVATMKKGELAEFRIAPEYAYGASGSPPKIPANATLIFEVELIRWESEDLSPDRDGTISRDVIVKGEELAHPNDTSDVEVHAVGSFEGRVFYDRDITFSLGEGSEAGLPEGVDRAIRRMTRGEKSIIHIKGTRFTYGTSPPAEYQLPSNAPIDFTIFLKSFVKVPATWELTVEQKLETAQEAKERGTHFLKEGKFKLALNKYKRIEDLLEYERTADPSVKEKRDALMVAAYLNIALTHSKMNEELECIKACDKVLELSPGNVKALYRKGMAKLSFSDFDEALTIFEKVMASEPGNKAAEQQILICKQKIKEFEQREKRRFKGLFAKLGNDVPEEQEQKNPSEEKVGEENAEPMEGSSA